MTRDQLGACMALTKEGFTSIIMPIGVDSPIPGVVLMADVSHTKLLMVQPDGTVVDLLAVHAAAEDTVRNWHNYPDRKLAIPHFVGDFGRLTKLARAVTGRKIKAPMPDSLDPTGVLSEDGT